MSAVRPDDGVIVGASGLADFDLENEHAHIGWTAWDPRVWATAVNPEAKLLRLGAQFEGVLRRMRTRADGTWRDDAVYSVLAEEWPAVRAGLEARLAAHGAVPVVLR